MTFQVIAGGDEDKIRNTPAREKFFFLELSAPGTEGYLDRMLSRDPPRLIRSHLPSRYFRCQLKEGEGTKIIVTIRNPKDTLVSMYHFYRMNKLMGCYEGSWEEFFEMYRQDALTHETYMKYYIGWAEVKDHPNVMLVKYEDSVTNPARVIQDISKFINRPLSEDQINNIVRMTSFDYMGTHFAKANPKMFDEKISKFFRSGKVGDWKNYFSEEQSSFVDEQYERLLKPLGLELEFEWWAMEWSTPADTWCNKNVVFTPKTSCVHWGCHTVSHHWDC